MIPTIFRVTRKKIDGQTVQILLEPYIGDQMVTPNEGDEFVTGTLSYNPWDTESKIVPGN